MVRLLTLAALFVAVPAFAQKPPTREEKVRNDKTKVEADGYWIYNDLPKAFAEAKQSGKPIIAILRCIPCEECVKLDDDLVNTDPVLRPLLDQFIRVRIVMTNGLDLSLFQFDTDQSFAAFFLNADKTIYGRFGTRSHRTNWVGDVSVAGLAKALNKTLDLHRGYPANKDMFTAKRGPAPDVQVPEQLPTLKGKYAATLNYTGNVVQSCIHCHQIGDAQRDILRTRGEPIPEEMLFPYPHPKSIGLVLDPTELATVSEVVKGSPAEAAGFQVGHAIRTLAGQPILSLADVQWVLHNTPASGASVKVVVDRGDEQRELTLTLPSAWRRAGDISWRSSTWGLRRMATGGMVLEELTPTERTQAKIADGSMALRVKHVGQYGPHAAAKNAGFKQGDLVIAFDNKTNLLREADLIAHGVTTKKPGDKVAVEVIRGSKKKRSLCRCNSDFCRLAVRARDYCLDAPLPALDTHGSDAFSDGFSQSPIRWTMRIRTAIWCSMLGFITAAAGCGKGEPDSLVRPEPVLAPLPPKAPLPLVLDPARSPTTPRPADAALDLTGPGEYDDLFPIPQDPVKATAIRRRRLEDQRRHLVGVFEVTGDTKATWADKARAVLETNARCYVQTHGRLTHEADARTGALEAAVSAGCTDPLIVYLAGQFVRPQPAELRAIAQELTATCDQFDKAKYPACRRAYALWNAYVAHLQAYPTVFPPEPNTNTLWERFWVAFEELSRERTYFAEEATADIAREVLEKTVRQLRSREVGYKLVSAHIAGASEWTRRLVDGRYWIKFAWDARGSGFADQVEPEKWEVFQDRLAKAEETLVQAYEIDRTRPDPAVELLTIATGLAYSRPKMEQWFRRALEADPDNYDACFRKLNYLQPKWHGSVLEALAFGRQCHRTQNWDACLPMILAEAHDSLGQGVNPAEYYAVGENWADVRAAYEGHLKHRMGDRQARCRYAIICLARKDYTTAAGHLNRVGGRPTKPEFETDWIFAAALREAEAKSSRPAAEPNPPPPP